mgnify:CR=1 FL=1
MRKPLSLIVADIIGIAFAFAMIFMASYLSFYTIRDSPELQTFFQTSLILEIVAAFLLLPDLIVDFIVATGKPTIPDRWRRPITLLLKALGVISPILACFTSISGYTRDAFLSLMAFVAYPCVLIIAACGFSLINCFLKQPEQPEQPDR